MPKANSAFSRDNTVFDTTIGWRFFNRLIEEQYGADSMPETAENVAQQNGIERDGRQCQRRERRRLRVDPGQRSRGRTAWPGAARACWV